ncbi:MAG: ribonuclease HII [Prevotellaceae bacterium]|nr:ribonuclease HII [Prevotellaceae bacterium]
MPNLLPYHTFGCIEAGCDEAGRGCLAGSVFAAAVILPENFECEELNDSKQLTENQRNKLKPLIQEKSLAWAVAEVTAAKIDEINILNASILAMQQAVSQLKIEPQHLIIDGNKFKPYKNIPYHTIVKGDGKYLSIAAASVLAKTFRDEYMTALHNEFPQYCWAKNKGYPTKKHRQAIENYGITPYHRKTFQLINPQMKLF